MKPLKHYGELCRSMSKEAFSASHDNPFLLYSVVRGGDLKPADVSTGLTLDRLVLEDACREAVGGSPENWYVVFEVVPKRAGTWKATLGCTASCDVQLDDASISRLHASVERRADGYYLTDEDSSAGTSVDGKVLEPRVPTKLEGGSRVGLGNVDVVFHLPEGFYDFVHIVTGS